MDPYVRVCEELFSACRTEFKHLEYFYFHNFLYEQVWKDNFRRQQNTTPTMDLLHTYSSDYKVIFVGDATMGAYEISHQYGSVEHMNEEPGYLWMKRLTDTFDKVIWLNPTTREHWQYTTSIEITKDLLEDHMYPLTLAGLDEGIAYLTR